MQTKSASEKEKYRNVWVVAETVSGQIQSVTGELLGKARELADKRGCEVWCVVLGAGVSGGLEELFHQQADAVLLVEDQRLESFVEETRARLLVRLIEKHRPEILLCGATVRGRALVPRLAALAWCGLTADCTGLDIDTESGSLLLQTRPAYGGNIIATIKSENHRPQMATVRPRVMQALSPDPKRRGRIIREQMNGGDEPAGKRVLRSVRDTEARVKLVDARYIIAGGRGLKGPEGFKLLEQLAALVGGAVGASRSAVDAGWAAYQRQIGQTGQTVQPKVYIACGISGQIQHLVGMQSSDLIVAINKDPEAPLMKLADIALVGDLFEIVPELIRELQRT